MIFERLAKHHDKKSFDCGNDDINRYLWQMASQHHKRGVARVHILADGASIVGFYTLINIQLDNSNLAIKGCPRQIPAVLIGRMGVDKRHQGQGLSKVLLSHALNKIKSLSLDTAIMFAVIDAKDERLAQYYQSLEFVTTDTPLRLIYPVDKLAEC